MFSNQLEKLLKKDKYSKKSYCGVISVDKLPIRKVSGPCGFIINNQESDQQGEHWFSIYIPRFSKVEYFDSFGLYPQDSRVQKFLRKQGRGFIYNIKRIQSDNSENCGKFCVFYLYFKSRNYSMKKIIKFFTNNFENNDIFIESFFRKIK